MSQTAHYTAKTFNFTWTDNFFSFLRIRHSFFSRAWFFVSVCWQVVVHVRRCISQDNVATVQRWGRQTIVFRSSFYI